MMSANHLEVKNSHLIIGGVDTVILAERFGAPLYITNEARIRVNYQRFQDAFPDADIYYAAKANYNLTVLRILAEKGAGADVFSDGELYCALKAGIPSDKILFNGNSKTDAELEMAVKNDIRVSVDSLDELRTLSEIAHTHDHRAEVAFRVNPDVSPSTHPKIATGLRESKFGIPSQDVVAAYKEALSLENIKPVGIHCHIGSQILDVTPFVEATKKMMDLVEEVTRLGIQLEFIDLGGGLGISYENEVAPSPNDLANAILPVFAEGTEALEIQPKLILEPGRYIMADTTILLAKVNTVKHAYRNFVGVDAGLNLLVRPVMYDAYHGIVVANKAGEKSSVVYTIVGPICEAGDVLARDRFLPKIEKGDLIAILDVGAYGFSMSSQYNGRPRCAELLVCEGKVDVIRKGESYDDLLASQILPSRFR
ncbi:MAG: diaminopimelate decarboxylase [Euryarchaeota archaeon]|nr:diaminopimelate decarboxylase [Euryarchaeota archaeon]